MVRRLILYIVPALAATIFGLAPAGAAITVNCGTFPGISDALAAGNTDITVNGTCFEDVLVRADDVTIASGFNGEVVGTVTAVGAQRFRILGMAVTVPEDNPNEGILVMNGASATVSNVTVTGSVECAILVFMNSFAEVFNSTIDGNGFGLCASTGSFLRGRNNTVTNSVNAGVEIGQHGSYRGRNETIDNTGGGDAAITLRQNSYVDLRPGFVTGDIVASDQSLLRVRQSSTVAGNVQVDVLSELDLTQTSSVSGDVTATSLSVAKITGGATVAGKVKCGDKSLCLP